MTRGLDGNDQLEMSYGDFDGEPFAPNVRANLNTGAGDEKVVHTIRACSVYHVRPLQCRTWPFWPENLANERAWNQAAKKCHGMNAPGRSFSLNQIHAIRDAAEWPKNPPTSKAPAKKK